MYSVMVGGVRSPGVEASSSSSHAPIVPNTLSLLASSLSSLPPLAIACCCAATPSALLGCTLLGFLWILNATLHCLVLNNVGMTCSSTVTFHWWLS